MTPKTTREKWLLSFVPGFGVFVLGWLLFIHPAEKEVTRLRNIVERQGSLSARQAQVVQASAEQTTLERAIAAKRTVLADEEILFDRNTAMHQVSVLCAENGLSLNAAAVEASAKLPPALKDATPTLTRNPAATPPEVWKIELTGGYGGVLNLLGGLQKAKPIIVPLTISMQAGKNDRQPAKWVLDLWL